MISAFDVVEDVEFYRGRYGRKFPGFPMPSVLRSFRSNPFPNRRHGASPVGIAVREPFGDFTIRLDAFGVGMDDVAQEFGIQRVAGGAVEFEQHVARLRAEPGAPCLFCVLAHTAPVRLAPSWASGVSSGKR